MGSLPPFASGPLAMPRSGIREIINIALGMEKPIRLEVGEPNFNTPAHIVEAAQRFMSDGVVKYVGTQGIPSLREKIAAKVKRVNRIEAPPEQVNVGVGGIGVIAAIFTALVEPGDEVLVPDPAWPCYELMLGVTGGRIVTYSCAPENGFLPDPAEIAALCGPRTKLLVVNSPSNPTGAVFSRALIEELVGIAERKGIYLLSDECYDEVVFDCEHVSPASIAGTDRVLTAMSFSKTYAMTGWRIGYSICPPDLVDLINKVHESNISCVSTISQKAAEAALDGPREPLTAMVDAYRRRRDLCVDLLEQSGLLIARPGGAFYIMADISSAAMNARDFALALLRETGVAVAPGTAFGRLAHQAVRISLASSEQDLTTGIGRIAEFVRARGR